MHGYALAFAITFECDGDLDERGWVIDFGALADIKDWLVATFDHTTVVARDDPQMDTFVEMKRQGLIDLVVVKATGCEAFAAMVFKFTNEWLHATGRRQRVRVVAVDCMEHGANKATVIPDYDDAG